MSHRAEEKILSLSRLKAFVDQARKQGRRIVLTNGCFDLLHVGHIRYLAGARSMGDLVICALNSDASVRKYKGAGRPIQGEADRAEIVASLEYVDCVYIFDDPTVDRLLRELKPDIHAKGTDYTHETVPERETVQAYGGRTAIAGDPKDHSTNDLIQVILARFQS